VLRSRQRRHPVPRRQREVEGRQGPLADDHRMDELDRDMLRVGSVLVPSASQQPAAAQEALRHRLGGPGEALALAREEGRGDPVAFAQEILDEADRIHRQQILGSGSPTSMSTTRVPPYDATPRTVRAGSSRTSPMITASSPPGTARRAARAAPASSGATTARN